LHDVDPSINLNNNANANANDNTSINNIYNSATQAIKTQYDIKIIKEQQLNLIHERDDYPLSYIFFKCLYETELLNRILSHPPDITDLHTFMDWHRENIEYIDFDLIHTIMNELYHNNNNNNDNDNDVYEELKLVYALMFKPTGIRKILHDAIYDNKFISVDVQYDLESVDLQYTEYLIDERHRVHLFVPKDKSIPDLTKIAVTINTMESLAKIYTDRSDIPPVDLKIIFSDQKKTVYPWTRILCCDNINSGSTYPGVSIVCWRREEFQKVLIHELFHYYKFDFYKTDPFYNQLSNMILIPKINESESDTDMLNECYTEACTIIILILIRYVMLNLNNNSTDDLYRYLISHLKIEITFIMFQVAKMISIFGGDSFNDYVTGKTIIKQRTSFRSYFMVKLLLLYNIYELLDFINDSMVVSNERLLQLGNLINSSWIKFLKDDHNIRIIDNFISQNKEAFNTDDNRWIFRTCRMCVNDSV